MRALFVVALLFVAPVAQAQTRYTSLFEEYVESKAEPRSLAETAMVRQLVEAGAVFVDERQARTLRGVTDAGKLLAGEMPAVITTLDADVIIAGVVRCSSSESATFSGVKKVVATADAKLIATDTGRVLATFVLREGVSHFDARVAASKAAEMVGARLAAEILKKNASAPARPVLATIDGTPGVSVLESIATSIERLDVVASVRVRHAGRGPSSVEITPKGVATARTIALAIDRANIGLAVSGYSDGTLRATYRQGKGLSVALVVARADGGRPQAMLTTALFASLADLDFVEASSEPSPVALDKNASKWSSALRARGLSTQRALVLVSSSRTVKRRLHAEAKLLTGSGKVVLSEQVSCDESDPPSCFAGLGDLLASKLPAQVDAKRQWFGGASRVVRGTTVVASSIDVEGVYPARLMHYAEHGLGKVTVDNRGSEPVRNVTVRAEIAGLTTEAVDTPVGDIPAGGQAKVAMKLVLDRAVLQATLQQRVAVLRVDVEHDVEGQRVFSSKRRAVVVFPSNAMNFRRAETSIAAFVAPSSVANIARGILKSVSAADAQDPLGLPVAMFAAMSKLRYVPDGVHPYRAKEIDLVQFPLQTLARGTGDCDDLAVLFAALVEAAGRRSMLVTTPGHLMAAVQTSLPSPAAAELSIDPDRVIEHGGRVWIVVETSRVGASFEDAWRAGAERIGALRARGEAPGLIDIREGWTAYPAIDLAPPGDAVELTVSPIDVRGQLEASRSRRAKAMSSALQAAKANAAKAANGHAHNDLGVWWARAGELANAKAAFERAAADPTVAAEALNNLANLTLLSGDVAAARARYAVALERAPKRLGIRLNAAVAAWADGDKQAFAEHVADCFESADPSAHRNIRGMLDALGQPSATRGDFDRVRIGRFVRWL